MLPAAARPGTDDPGVIGLRIAGMSTLPPQQRWPRAWLIFLVAGGAVDLAYYWVPHGVPQSVVYTGVSVLALVAIAVGVRINRPVRRAPWFLLLVCQGLWVLGNIVGSVMAARGVDHFPSAEDAFYFAAYPVLVLSLLLLARGRRPPRDVEGILDGLTMIVVIGLLISVVLDLPTVPTTDEPLDFAVVAAYPQLDAVIFVVIVFVITTPGVRTTSLRLLVVALGLLAVVNVAATALGTLTFSSAGPLDHLWLAAYVLVGTAVLHPSLHELSIPVHAVRGRFSRWRFGFTLAITLIPPLTLVAEDLLPGPVNAWPIAWATAIMLGLVVMRMYLVIRQIAAAQADREEALGALVFQATHDSLTGLPNRAHVLELVTASLVRAQLNGAMVGLLFVDLDGFKAVNDTYGHHGGDEVLQTVARRMEGVLRRGDVVGRLGGDEFLVLLEPVVDIDSAMRVAERLIREVSVVIPLQNGHVVRVGASVGVAISQEAGTNADELLYEADTATYRAKHLGRGRAEVFGVALRRELRDRAELETGLRQAIEDDALTVRYAPVVTVSDQVVLAYEVCLSWDRPGYGLVPETAFRPVAELSDLTAELDAWVLRHATRQMATWNAHGARLGVGVDVAVRYLARARVIDDIKNALEESGIEPWQLVIEVNDTTLVDDPIVFGHLDQIRQLGVRVALEDFGTGYSSVRRLLRLPIDLVKLNGGFLDWSTPASAGLVRLIVQGVEGLGLPLAVTGVIDAKHAALLNEMGCDMMQGPYFEGPFSGSEVTERLGLPWNVASSIRAL